MLLHYVVKVEKPKMDVNTTSAFNVNYKIASMDDVPVKIKTSLDQAFSQVVDGMNLCFTHGLLYNTPNK